MSLVKGTDQNPVIIPDRCTYCGGNGRVRQTKVFLQCNKLVLNVLEVVKKLLTLVVIVMDRVTNKTKKVSVTIPKGVDDGTRIRLAGKGEAGVRGGTSGDLYLFINVETHQLFKRSDVNLFFEFPISIADAALGTTIEIPTIDGGKAKIKIPEGTQNEKQFRLKGKGTSFMRRGDYGDLYVQVKTEVPVYLNKEQKDLLEKFRKIENEKSNPSIKKFFSKSKNLFGKTKRWDWKK